MDELSHPANLRPLAAGQGTCGTRRSNLPDRLVEELRQDGAKTIEQANAALRAILPRYNTHFAVPAERADPSYRPWCSQRLLE